MPDKGFTLLRKPRGANHPCHPIPTIADPVNEEQVRPPRWWSALTAWHPTEKPRVDQARACYASNHGLQDHREARIDEVDIEMGKVADPMTMPSKRE